MDLKAAARDVIFRAEPQLIDLSHRIHANPELGYEERKASRWLCDLLAGEGFDVATGICELETAFAARAGSGPLHIAICAEYDCLPGIGHACGHNVIAGSAVGAGMAAKLLADELGITVTVLGTPAEEVGDGSGKILMLERGGFDGQHAAMMVHPAPADIIEASMLALASLEVHYHGKAAHASAFPEFGINAADAMVIAQTAIGLMRQQMRAVDRVHGIITRGGEAPNVIPAHTSADYFVRSRTIGDLEEIKQKVLKCFEAGALATGARLEVIGGTRPAAEVIHDHELAAVFRRNAESLGRNFISWPNTERGTGSTDMGNVSQVIPSIHPLLGINSLPALNHQPEFAAHCATPIADKTLLDGALAMAWTIIDAAQDSKLRGRLTSRVYHSH